MITIPGVSPLFMWIGFIALILFFLFIDLGFFNKKQHTLSVKEAVIWSLVWFGMAMAFNAFIWYQSGSEAALQFFTGYLIEESLSVDNLFVILLIFQSFRIDPRYQHRVLFWGILGALVMRGIMIGIGAALITTFHWVLYIFGAFLIFGGISIFFKREESYDPHNIFIVRWIKKVVHVSKENSQGKFFVSEHGRLGVTILFVVLMVIEFTDVVFALDSVPAIFGITRDPFIVFTSNIFAILGLRSLYFVILKAHSYFALLPMGLAVILIFIGLKMLLEPFIHISIYLSLGVVASVLAIYIATSVLYVSHKKHKHLL